MVRSSMRDNPERASVPPTPPLSPLQQVLPRVDDPIELLQACHDKVRRFAALACRLRDHLATMPAARPPDAQAVDAASAILRYFDIAAPLHHDDEELNLFPALRALGHAPLAQAIDALAQEHGALAARWQALHPWLEAIAQGQAHPAPAGVDAFATHYIDHARREEAEVYPWASHLPPQEISRIADAMVRRRTHR